MMIYECGVRFNKVMENGTEIVPETVLVDKSKPKDDDD